MDPSIIQHLTILAVPLLLAITLHEAAHAFAARHFGDATAYMLGRMTLNPLRHIDPLWTIAIPLVTALTAGFPFGAAKPVPVNFANLRNPKRDMIWVAAAGPLANLAMMCAWAVVVRVLMGAESGPAFFLFLVAQAGVKVNAIIMVFNLLPILPLDGGRIVTGILPRSAAYSYSRMEPYGMFVIIGLLMLDSLGVTSFFGSVVSPLVSFSIKAIYAIIGLS